MEYITMFLFLIAAYVAFRVAAWAIITTVKFAFLVAFLSLGVLVMSNSVGLI